MGVQRLQAVGLRIFGIDVRALAAFRIGAGLILLGDLVVRGQYLTAHYTDLGILPRSARMLFYDQGANSRYWWSLHMLGGHQIAQLALFLLAAWFAVWLVIGYRTQLATVVSWILLTSLHSRNPTLLQGGDTMLRCLLFWAMFLPLGAAWSVDRAVAGGRRTEPRIFTAATTAILLQVAMVYWCTAAYKMPQSLWTGNYTAVYYALHVDQFATLFGQWLRQFPAPLAVLTFATVGLETAGPLLAF
ncbi:MAG: hypothetical protein GTO04_01035, partial [Planctomycetales bacterium]|nr:hypothetical protein [Planctomycetales bacterium]